MKCLSDELVLVLVEGNLAPAQLASVDEHLDGCIPCRELVSAVASTYAPTRVLARGTRIGRYVIGALLGTGAMGRVYSAWEPELDRHVAIKLLLDDGADSRECVVHEARAMARVVHANVVTVHEVGSTEHGVHVVMELVDGQTLRAWAETPRSIDDRVRVLVETARGLAAVHAAGLVHRDVKPDNVIVGRDGRVRLGDFGLARRDAQEQRRADGSLALEASASALAGTPAYMAPEVLRGGAADAASNQFSFGVLAYELLDGRRPFVAETWSQLVTAVHRAELRAPRGAPGWLADVIRRSLAPERARRFPSMDALADHLVRHGGRRRPMRWIAAAVAAATFASAATWMAARDAHRPAEVACDLAVGWDARARAELAAAWAGQDPTATRAALAALDRWNVAWAHERAATCKAPASQQIAARDRCLAARRDEMARLFGRLDEVPVDRALDALASLAPPRECRSADAGTADPLPLDPEHARRVRAVEQRLAEIRADLALGTVDVDATLERLSQLLAEARASGHAPTLAHALLVQAMTLRAASRLADAAATARDAVAAAERGHADDLAARAWLERMAIAGDRRDLDAADDAGAIAQAAIERAGLPPHLAASLVRMRGLVAYNRGQLAIARTFLADARARFGALADGAPSLDIAAVESALGSVARAAGELDGAEQHHRAALAIDRELRAASHPDIARDLHNLAGVLRLRGDLDRALATYREALAIEIQTQGESSAASGLTHNSIGLVLFAAHALDEARVELELARDILTAAGHGDRGFPEHNLGLVAQAEGDHRRALAHFERAQAIFERTIGGSADSPVRLKADRERSQAALHRPIVTGHAKRDAPKPDVPQPDAPKADVLSPLGSYGAIQTW